VGRRVQAHRITGLVVLAAYIGTIFAANWFVAHVGEQTVPGGPHTIPVGFGFQAPSGVLWAGLAFTLRDLVQTWWGRVWSLGAIVVGALLSGLVAPELAVASAAAFLVGEGLDFAVYTPLAERGRWLLAVAASNTTGAVVDSLLFLALAFGSVAFWQGQVIGKLGVTVATVLVLWPLRRRLSYAAVRIAS
jgi:queuosine precursor transporter